MTDPLQVLNAIFAALGSNASAVPGRSNRLPGQVYPQSIDGKQISRISRTSRGVEGATDPSRHQGAGKPVASIVKARASDSLQEVPGNSGKPGKAGKGSVLSTLFNFPSSSFQTVLSGNEGEPSFAAKPAGAGPGSPDASLDPALLVPPGDVRAGVARELKALASLGRTGPTALRDAVEIVRAKIRNAPVMVEKQALGNRCHVCNERLDGTRPEVAILQVKPGVALHMHAGECHDAHRLRRTAVVDGIMAAAGYGASPAAEAAPDQGNASGLEARSKSPCTDALNDRPALPDVRDT